VLAVTAAVILAAFGGKTESLIPLYALGVFLAFTLSQAGMVVHWWRRRDRHWRRSLVVNGTGAVASGAVLLTAAVTKFAAGAWVVVVGIPLAVACLLRVKAHYTSSRCGGHGSGRCTAASVITCAVPWSATAASPSRRCLSTCPPDLASP